LIQSNSLLTPHRNLNSWWISLSCGLYWFAFSMTRPIISVYALSNGITGLQLGTVLSVYALLPMIVAVPSGFIADAIGRTNVLRVGAGMMIGSGVVYLISNQFWILVMAQILARIGQMAVWLAVQVMITGGSKEGSEGRFATFSLYMALGQLLAPVLSGFLSDHNGYTTVFIGYTFTSMLLFVSAWKCQDESFEKKLSDTAINKTLNLHNATSSLRVMAFQSSRLIRNRIFAVILLTTFISLFIMDVRTAYLPVYLESLSMSHTQIGLLISSAALSSLFVRPIYPILIRKIGFRQLLIWTYIVSLLLLFLSPILHNYYALFGIVFITGLALGINQPLTLSMIAKFTEPSERGLGIGLRLMANRTSQLLDPLLFGIFTAVIGIRGAFIGVGLILAFFCLATFWLYIRFEGEEAAKQVILDKPVSNGMEDRSQPVVKSLEAGNGHRT
jgi:MFS family permease